MLDLSTLNPRQREAVMHGDGPLLVLAGAGSGKTRVITYRIAYLIGELGVRPQNILAVTFTNKAAAEMLHRVDHLVPPSGGYRPWIGTFHSTSLRILRRYADRLGFTKSFAVYDTSDQLTLIRRCMQELNVNDDAFPPRSVLSRISNAKNELIGPVEYEKTNHDFFGARVSEVYRLYQKRLREFDAMDFDDLIGKYVELLTQHEDVRDELHDRFQHLLIDEYQDTNHAQYTLVKALAGPRGNVMAVGDEDQSIYRFRGADINNILNFERDFPGAEIVKLEQNYRSTGNILDAATGVVSNNVARKGKTLFTKGGRGEPVRIVTCGNDRDEAQFVLEKISSLRSKYKLTDFAVLFRTNAQSRPFEEELLRANLPYVVVGGVKFYERAEIKDILSYLRIAVRPHDTPSIERVINVPSRGIGDTTVAALDEAAAAQNVSLWTIIEGDLAFLPPRASKAVREFREIIHDLQRAVSQPVPELIDYVLLRTGYRRMLQESRDVQDESRMENLEELINSAREFVEQSSASSLGDYLDSLTLMSDVDRYESEKGVTLMTLHSAKGLEFRVVFLAGMEEGILPHARGANGEVEDLEEERRLCYVGMTRAREMLFCLHAHERRVHGRFREQSPSPFLDEIPEEAREHVKLARAYTSQVETWRERPISGGGAYGSRGYGSSSNYGSSSGYGSSGRGSASRPPEPRRTPPSPSRPASPPAAAKKNDNVNGVLSFFQNAPVQFDPSAIQAAKETQQNAAGAPELKRGQRVRHEQFGIGTILTMEGSGPDAKLTVYFDRAGSKKFVAKFAKLTRA
ncbi:MAG TPA: UvrD-helicase domain-containing protein [Thermoanaerobaculia bacterium]|nr:UvrD-helicase domain-containing protein [Thermoanaerobaculia bacterium]